MRYVAILILSLISIIILRVNFKLHSDSHTNQKNDILLQLNFLEKELKTNNLGERMQQIFPEGFIFVNALYGLAWCELSLSDINDVDLKKRALKEALYAFDNLNSETAKWDFPSDLNPEYGIFYNGWKNYLLSKILSVDTTFNDSKKYIKTFKEQSDTIKNACLNSDCPFLESYNDQSWPADMFVAMASLSNYDKIFIPKYQFTINNWIQEVKTKLDPKTNLVPHKVDSKTGKTVEGARGCSIGLILRMLGEINQSFAKEQFELMKIHFISKTFGLPSVREYPKGQYGLGDVDSGPVLFGVGFSATIVMIGTLSMYNNQDLADKQYRTINAFGFDRKTQTEKKYLLGKFPMADAFIVWGRATDLNYSPPQSQNSCFWGFKFHLISALVLFFLWTLFFIKPICRYIKKNSH